MRILFSCTNSFLFKNFDQEELNIIVRMMNKVITQKDEVIINEE